jgi:DNA primase large subunit
MYRNLLREHIDFILHVAHEFGIDFIYDEHSEMLSVYFVHYLRYAPTRYKTWKMINRKMSNGYVAISEKDFSRLLQEAFRYRINQELVERTCNPHVVDVFSDEVRRFQNETMMLRKKSETEPVGKLDITKLPPCLKDILGAIQAGENVPHMGRFALVAFLNSLHMNSKDILRVFSSAPDFEEERTRYQIEHITGSTGSTSYSAPGCDKLKTYGLCPSEKMDQICRQVNHPLKYYRKQWREKTSADSSKN